MSEYVAGNIYVRQNRMAKGQTIAGHRHNFDHLSYVKSGAVHLKATVLGVVHERTVRATDDLNWLMIAKGVEHEITALEDGTVFHCFYSHRTPQGEVVEEYTGWDQAYV